MAARAERLDSSTSDQQGIVLGTPAVPSQNTLRGLFFALARVKSAGRSNLAVWEGSGMFEKYPILVLDTETGGLSSKDHSLLTIAGVAWNPREQPRPLFSFYVKEPQLYTTAKALEINKVDLRLVESEGLTPKEAVEAIQFALDQHYGPSREPICMCGHNIGFDVGFVQRLYKMAGAKYSRDFTRATLDTVTIFRFFMAAGLISPGKANGDRMFQQLGIPIPEEHRHTALGDAWATALSLSRMAQSLKRGQLPSPALN